MAVKDEETLEERRHRALTDADLRAKIAKEAHETQQEVALDGLSKHVTYLDKDGRGLADETVATTFSEAVEAFKNELLLAVIGVVPAALSGEIEVKPDRAGKADDDEVTVVLTLSRTQPSARLPKKNQGTQAK